MSDDQPPVAMLRGSIRLGWALYGFNRRAALTHLASASDGRLARKDATRWCAENGYYLSAWSDADDRGSSEPRLDPDREHDCDEDGETPCSICGYVSGMYDNPEGGEPR